MSTTPVTPKLTLPSHTGIHLFYLALVIVLGVMAHVWLSEHDERLLAEQTVKVSKQHEADLEAQLKALSSVTAAQVKAVQAKVATVKTVPQAIAAIPELSNLPLNARPIPSMPDDVAVNAVALTQELGACRTDRIELGSCQQAIVLKDGIIAEEKTQIAALTAKPKFWHRVGSKLKNGSILISIGILVGKVLL